MSKEKKWIDIVMESRKPGVGTLAEQAEAKIAALTEQGGLKRVPFDHAFIEKAVDGLFEGARDIVAAGEEVEPAQFVFPGTVDAKTDKLTAFAFTQGMGMTNDKKQILAAVKDGLAKVEGRIIVALVDEAWGYKSKNKDGKPDAIAQKIIDGKISVSELPLDQRSESVIINLLGLGFQYLCMCPISKDANGKRTLTKGELVKVDENFTGGAIANWAKPN